jgi:adenosylmethionine-8-amino-7-oxononanoate aminotransferase
MSVCDPDGGMHSLWRGVLPEQVFVPTPPPGFDSGVDYDYVTLLADTIEQHADELAAVIIEPVVQGAGGMRFIDPRYLHVLRELTLAHDILLVFDEVATGFGRTGTLFAADHAAVSPDVMCIGKAMTGGYLSMAATLCSARIADGISQGQLPVLAHGPTYMGNPLAAAVANASIDLLLESDWAADIRRLESGLIAGLEPVLDLPGVLDVRVLGGIGVVQLDHPVDITQATKATVEAGVWLRPFRDLIYTMPPYITCDEDLALITKALCAAVAAS